MKNIKKYFSYFIILAAALVLMACGSDTGNQASDSTTGSSNEDMPYIGILQLTSHPALDAISEGIIDELESAGYINGETATIDLQNAQGDQANMQSIAERFITNDADIMIGIATPAAQALANASTDIPIIMGAITDPVAANLIDSLETPGGNITGVSDQIPIGEQFDLIMTLLPDIETIGFIYSSSEDNSASAANEAQDIAEGLGLKVITKTVNSANDIAQVAESLAADVDAIWVPTDNTLATSTPTLIEVTDAYKIPVFPSVNTMVEEGGLATVGLNQYDIGIQTGAVIVEVLEGADPSEFSIQFPNKIEMILNISKAETLNIVIPEEHLKDAIIIE